MMRWNCESLTKSHNGSWFKLSEQEYAGQYAVHLWDRAKL